MRVEFRKAPGGGSVALIDRPDGVRLRLRSYDRKSAVPHDIAHLVVERTFRLGGGLWGSIAAGAVFASVEELSGRLRHDRRERSKAVLRANADDLGLAEILSGWCTAGWTTGTPSAGTSARRGAPSGPVGAPTPSRTSSPPWWSCAPWVTGGRLSPLTRPCR